MFSISTNMEPFLRGNIGHVFSEPLVHGKTIRIPNVIKIQAISKVIM